MQLPVETAVLNRGGGLRGHGGHQRGIFRAQRLTAGAAAERQHRDRRVLADAWHEVEQPLIAPELDLLGGEAGGRERIVEAHGVTALQARADARGRSQLWRRRAVEALLRQRLEITLVNREEKGHAIELDGFAHARHHALGQAIEVEVAVQLAREADQRAAIVVAIAIEGTVDRILQAVLHRLGQQHHHHRGEERDDPAMLVFTLDEVAARRAQDQHVDRDDGGDRRGVDQQTLEDDLDVHQAIADDRRRERERHEAERHGRQPHRDRGLDPQRKRNRVAEGERQRAERRAPDDPAELTLHGHRARTRQGAEQDRQARAQIQREIDVLEAIEHRDDADEIFRIESRAQHRQRAGGAKHGAGQINRRQPPRQQRGVARHVRALREHEREVQEQRRQHHDRDGVAPVEHPVDAIEPAAEREGEQAEEGDRQPEEVQRRLVGRPPRAHGGADQQREDADRREDVVVQTRAVGHRRQRQIRHFTRAEPQQRVGVAVAGARLVLDREHVGAAFDRLIVDGQQDVARPHTGPARGRRRGDLGRHHAHGALDPEHAVFHFVGGRARNDVGQTERQQRERHRHGQRRLPPLAPPRFAVVLAMTLGPASGGAFGVGLSNSPNKTDRSAPMRANGIPWPAPPRTT